MATKISTTLQCINESTNPAARAMHKFTLKTAVLPRPGDFIKDTDRGYAEVVRVVFDMDGDITLVIK